ncbi:Oidioi.mRNA.OKI2018_I69.chr2.g5413.t1.cds [Oikopleura dioica]|uniref:Oidioi.mRNA.OKI2018_I69.chr2.g5413.t1.cds n=1 Tax=Oikopleura dioica TaxID=34765 RepID=A0ABN7T4K5_OIKDI|nr:Oidioi.mRNA.OKI2018_I69.chr2.g5413.t1.cds [Oikopleura dioica]
MEKLMVEKLATMFSVSNVTSESPFFESRERFRFEIQTDLAQCFQNIPTDLNGGINRQSCRRTKKGQLQCRYDCDSSLLDHSSDVSCKCSESIAGVNFNIPCEWSGFPHCAQKTAKRVEKTPCGEISEENGNWGCSDENECQLKCKKGYKLAESSISRRKCSCNRHGCRWSQSFYSKSKSDESENSPRDSAKSSTEIVTSECVKENERDFRCDAPYHPVGQNKCTGMEHGDQCELECPDGFVKEQHGVKECVCDRGGACSWTGDAGTCTADLGELNHFFETFNLDNSLLHRKKCKELPETKRGKWVCEEEKGECQLTCSPGLEPSHPVSLKCHCVGENCAYRLTSGSESTFAPPEDFERELGFSCLEEYEYYDQEEEPKMDTCANLPDVKDGHWRCDSGSCTLWCSDSPSINVDCVNPDLTLESLEPLSCSSFASFQKSPRSHELHRLKYLAKKK